MKLATLCYVRRNHQTLMLHRVKKPNDMHLGKWNGLGGKFEPGESPEECVIREIYEEAGLRIIKPLLKGILTFPAFAKDEDWYAFVYIVKDFEGELIDSDEGILSWVDNDELLKLNLWEGDRIFIPWLDQPGFFSARFTYQESRLVDYSVNFYNG
jgi:8-oxo-dGTP diphosphatase